MMPDDATALMALMEDYGVDAVIETLTELIASASDEDLETLEALLETALAAKL